MRRGWHYAYESMDWIGNWHIDMVADYLTAVLDRTLGYKILIFSFPPRHMKSLGINVFMPAWAWAQDPGKNGRIREGTWRGPGTRFAFLAYNQKLSFTHSKQCRALIESDWYQRKWKERFSLNTTGVEEFTNDKGGRRFALSFGGTLTGLGGHILCVDDAHNRNSDSYEADRVKVIDLWNNAIQSRLDDQKNGYFIVSMQRTAENDLIGDILARGNDDVVHVCLPFEFEAKHPYVFLKPDDPKKHVIRRTDSSGGTDIGPRIGEVWEDRREEGKELWPDHIPKWSIESQLQRMTSHEAAGQYQQRPSAPEGSMFKREWFANPVKFVDRTRLQMVRAWDCAWTEDTPGRDPDYTVGVLMGRDMITRAIYVIDVVRGRYSPAQLENLVVSTAMIDGGQVMIRIPQDPGAGKFVARHLASKLMQYTVRIEPEYTSKAQRAAPFAAACEHDLVKLVEGEWNKEWIDEFCAFRGDDRGHDDQVDATTAGFRMVTSAMPIHAVAA